MFFWILGKETEIAEIRKFCLVKSLQTIAKSEILTEILTIFKIEQCLC